MPSGFFQTQLFLQQFHDGFIHPSLMTCRGGELCRVFIRHTHVGSNVLLNFETQRASAKKYPHLRTSRAGKRRAREVQRITRAYSESLNLLRQSLTPTLSAFAPSLNELEPSSERRTSSRADDLVRGQRWLSHGVSQTRNT